MKAIESKRKHMKSASLEEAEDDDKKFTAFDTTEVVDMSYLWKGLKLMKKVCKI